MATEPIVVKSFDAMKQYRRGDAYVFNSPTEESWGRGKVVFSGFRVENCLPFIVNGSVEFEQGARLGLLVVTGDVTAPRTRLRCSQMLVAGDVDTQGSPLHITGGASYAENIWASWIQTHGNLTVDHGLFATRSVKVAGSLRAGSCEVNEFLRVGRDLICSGDMHLGGGVRVSGDCAAGTLFWSRLEPPVLRKRYDFHCMVPSQGDPHRAYWQERFDGVLPAKGCYQSMVMAVGAEAGRLLRMKKWSPVERMMIETARVAYHRRGSLSRPEWVIAKLTRLYDTEARAREEIQRLVKEAVNGE